VNQTIKSVTKIEKEDSRTQRFLYWFTQQNGCYYSHKNKDLVKPNKTKQEDKATKQVIGRDLGFGLV